MIVECIGQQQPENSGDSRSLTYFSVQASQLRKNPLYYQGYLVVANTVVGHIIPFIFLVIINVLIVKTLNKAPTKADIMVANSRHVSKGKKAQSSMRKSNFYLHIKLITSLKS